MNAEEFYKMEPGDTLWLKSERAQAYGSTTGQIIFKGIKEDKKRKTPWILAVGGGCYRPSDFDKWEPQKAKPEIATRRNQPDRAQLLAALNAAGAALDIFPCSCADGLLCQRCYALRKVNAATEK